MVPDLSQIQYPRQTAIVKDYLNDVCGVEPLSPIEVYPAYPYGWYAHVATTDHEMVYTIGFQKGYMRLIGLSLCQGFRPNGKMILTSDGEEYEELKEFFEYGDHYDDARYHSPIACDEDMCGSSGAECITCSKFF